MIENNKYNPTSSSVSIWLERWILKPQHWTPADRWRFWGLRILPTANFIPKKDTNMRKKKQHSQTRWSNDFTALLDLWMTKRQAKALRNISFIWLFLILQVGNFLSFHASRYLSGLDAPGAPLLWASYLYNGWVSIPLQVEEGAWRILDWNSWVKKERRKIQPLWSLRSALFVGLTFHPIFSLVEAITLKQDSFSLSFTSWSNHENSLGC